MLTAFERAHAESIVDPNPTLMPIPQAKEPRLLAASIVRKPPQVITALLQTLAWQCLKKGTLDIILQPNFSAAERVNPDLKCGKECMSDY